jgi:hypothetical protein
MRKFACLISCQILIILFGHQGLDSGEKIKLERLELIQQFPLEEQEVFFKTTPKIVVDTSGYVYALDNMQHSLFKFDKNGNFIKKIGRNGQGPGDLQHPFFISLGENKIFISDNIGISVFDNMGRFINRFRAFRLRRAMAIFKDKVLLSESNSKNLITMFDQSGKILNEFGDIYEVNHPLLNKGGRYAMNVDLIINWGDIICSDKSIYFISSLFGDIFKFDQNGNLIKKKEIKDVDFLEKNKKYYFLDSTIQESRNKGLPLRSFFCDALCLENKIYLLLAEKKFYGEIWQLDENQMEVERKYSFFNFQEEMPTQIKSKRIGIFKRGNGKNLNFYISFSSSGESFINVYKRNMSRGEK